jgi:hypothetical protein
MPTRHAAGCEPLQLDFPRKAGTASAFEIETGSPEIEMRWDNTERYNYAHRVDSQKRALLGSPNLDDDGIRWRPATRPSSR